MATIKFQILSIHLQMPADRFANRFEELVNNFNNNNSSDFCLNTTKMSTRLGMDVTNYQIEDNDGSSSISIIAENVGKDVIFHPMNMKSLNSGFFDYTFDDEDLNNISAIDCFDECFRSIAIENEGLYGRNLFGDVLLIDKGKQVLDIKSAIYRTDKKDIYFISDKDSECVHDKDSDLWDDEEEVYVPKILLDEWYNDIEQSAIKSMTMGMPRRDQFETIAAYLVKMKKDNKISSVKFNDLFRQAGSFVVMFGGFTNPLIQDIYQFFSDSEEYDTY